MIFVIFIPVLYLWIQIINFGNGKFIRKDRDLKN